MDEQGHRETELTAEEKQKLDAIEARFSEEANKVIALGNGEGSSAVKEFKEATKRALREKAEAMLKWAKEGGKLSAEQYEVLLEQQREELRQMLGAEAVETNLLDALNQFQRRHEGEKLARLYEEGQADDVRALKERLGIADQTTIVGVAEPAEFKLPTTVHIARPESIVFNEEQLEQCQRLGVKVRMATEEEMKEALEAEAERRFDVEQGVGTEHPVGSLRSWEPFPGTAVYAAPFEAVPGQSSDRVTVSDNTGPLLHFHHSQEYTRDELMGRLSVVLGMPLEELEDRIEGRRKDPRQQELFDPDVETTPHPDAPDHVNRTVRKTNLPGGFLMNTREFEKWVLESFTPMQDLMVRVEERMDLLLERCKQVEKENQLLRSRVGRNEQVIKELKKAGK